MNKALPRWAVCAFFAVFLALGLLTAADYGPSWDEQTEMDILRMNLWEYARVLGLDESRFETLAARQGPLAIETLRPISQSIEQDHGTRCFLSLWLGGAGPFSHRGAAKRAVAHGLLGRVHAGRLCTVCRAAADGAITGLGAAGTGLPASHSAIFCPRAF